MSVAALFLAIGNSFYEGTTLKALIICIDGGDPAYFETASTPNLDRLGAEGQRLLVNAQMPTVTNVNNVSLICGGPPTMHGITANYFRERETGEEVYMESGGFLLSPTLMEVGAATGHKTAALASKKKLVDMVGKGADLTVTAEEPPGWLTACVGPQEEIYSAEVNFWLLRAALTIIEEKKPSLLYVTTTDFSQHKFGPETAEGQEHLSTIDKEIGSLAGAWADLHPDGAIFVTADHGMRQKRRAIDPGVVLRKRGISAEAVPIIKDRYVVHHGNQGGAAYVHLGEETLLYEAVALLNEVPGIEDALPREEAAARFRLLPGRMGEIMVIANEDTVFGVMDEAEREVDLRSHGSLHEQTVPLFAWNAPFFEPGIEASHFDAVRSVMDGLEG